MDWKKESEIFNQTANYYDKFRPSYPVEIIKILIQQSNLLSGSKLLEIGAGSGKATELFSNNGFEMLCIEPGNDLVAIGNSRFENENFKFVKGRFEEYSIPINYFDVVFSAQAFHWIPQPSGYIKCAEALKENGYLALFWNMYITYDNDLDDELVAISDKYGGLADFKSNDDCEKRIKSISKEIEESGYFDKPKIFRSLWNQKYTADSFFGFALTGNSFVQKSDNEKQNAYKELIQLADKHNGIIERPYLCVLYLSQKQ